MGRQFTQVMANLGQRTDGRVILYDEYPKFHARAWDNAGAGEDIWFEVRIFQRSGLAPPYAYAVPGGSTFNVTSRDDPRFFYDKQYYKSGETCTINFSLDSDITRSLATYAGASNIFAIQWVAYDRTSSTPLQSGVTEFTFIPEEKLLKLEEVDFIAFDRLTVYRPDSLDPPNWLEVEAPFIPMSVEFDEPFESAPKTLRVTMPDPDGLFLPQSQDNINYIGTAATGVYSPVFQLGNKVTYEKSLAYGTVRFPGAYPAYVNLVTYADQSRYTNRVWVRDGTHRKTPLVRQEVDVQYWDGTAWVDAHEGDEYDLFQHGVFFQDVQTAVRARGYRYNCSWEYCGLFYMGAPTYLNSPDTGNILKVDCQDRLSLLDKNGKVFLSTCEIQRFADKLTVHRECNVAVPTGMPYEDDPPFPAPVVDGYLKTWHDPALPGGPPGISAGLLLYFYDLNGPYHGNYAGINPIEDGSAAVWDDEFEVLVEYWAAPVVNSWVPLSEDSYQRTPYGILFDRDWSNINAPLPLPHVNDIIRITFQIFIPNTNPVNRIIQEILEYPNYLETIPGVPIEPGEYGGPGLESDDYFIPGISGAGTSDDWMEQDVNRFIWNHFNGSAFEAIKELMRIAGFPYNYRITAEPSAAWVDTPPPTHDPPEDVITFREVSQYPMDAVESMLMLSVNVKQKIEEDRMATLVRTRVFDDFAISFSHKESLGTRILWGPGVIPYEGGFNRCGGALEPHVGPTPTKDIANTWRPGQIENSGLDYFTDTDYLTHLHWRNTSNLWQIWNDVIPTPVLELMVDDDFMPLNLAALDIRNSLHMDVAGATSHSRPEWIGIRYGHYGDRLGVASGLGGLTVVVNTIGNVIPGAFETDELVGATIEITQAPIAADIGNTYPVIANNGPAGTIDVEIRDPLGMPGGVTLIAQLGGVIPPNTLQCIVKKYKWLPNFNRKLMPQMETMSWELDNYVLKDVRYFEIWMLKPAVVHVTGLGGSGNDNQYFDLGDIWLYDGGVTIGRPALARIRDESPEFPDESEDFDFGLGTFHRTDLFSRVGMRTHVLPDDKSLQENDAAFARCTETLYEELVIEDSYEIDGIYYPHIPRYSTILINIESMRIAFPALIESRSFSFAGTERSYKYILRNYNTQLPRMEHPEYS